MAPPAAVPDDARALIWRYERSLPASSRRTRGVHHTPDALARRVVDRAFQALGRLPQQVLDPTCGGGSFLLAAADALFEAGVDATEIVEGRLFGIEVDHEAAAVARAALVSWAADRGSATTTVQIVVADALGEVAGWGTGALGADLVVGNPPFLSQLDLRTARSLEAGRAVTHRFGSLGAYADSAGLFLLRGLEMTSPDAVVAMVQPQSFLAARDAASIRARVVQRAGLEAIWSSDGQPFDADVRVCVVILGCGQSRNADRSGTEVLWGPTFDSVGTEPVPADGASWGPMFATAAGLPSLPVARGRRLGDVASATAGFRDEFYALSDAIDGRDSAAGPRLVSVGMIDPVRLRWADEAFRIAGRRHLAPRLDMERLAGRAPRVARWSAARLVAKVVVATQTRVIEAAMDPTGDCVPLTPTISVEPSGSDVSLAHLCAVLTAPPVAVRIAREQLGAGLSPGAIRVPARRLLDITLPAYPLLWDRGAELVEQLHGLAGTDPTRDSILDQLGESMCAAYGLERDHEALDWWVTRRPRR